jgi:hypothetical protein
LVSNLNRFDHGNNQFIAIVIYLHQTSIFDPEEPPLSVLIPELAKILFNGEISRENAIL